jgi:GxxExxY protein
MHPLCQKAAGLTETIIAAAIEVHRDKGPGLIESIYEWCMLKELGLRGLAGGSHKVVAIEYRGFTREEPLRFDVLVEGCVLVEAKAVEKVLPIHKAQLLSYMKLLDVPLGLLINFSRNEGHRRRESLDPSRSKVVKRREIHRTKTREQKENQNLCCSLLFNSRLNE